MTTGPTPRFLLDNSVWQRLRQPRVRSALDELRDRHGPSAMLMCPPISAEVAFSARNAGDLDVVARALAAFPECERSPTSSSVLEIQRALIGRGLFRAVGPTDTVIAAYALANWATVVHYDRDFEYVARSTPAFRQVWIAPAGSLDR